MRIKKSLNQAEFQMKIIKDLGMLKPKPTSKKAYRFALFECSVCKKSKKRQVAEVKRSQQSKCSSCSATTHGLTDTKLYKVFTAMKARCLNSNHKHFKDYGGRGIEICNEWIKDFEVFEKWAMLNGYKKGLSIDRRDNDGNYEPDNCRWTTTIIQSQNTRIIKKSNTSGYRGVKKNGKNWVAVITVDKKRINLGTYKCRLQGAYHYDKYIIDNNLEHPTNIIPKNEV